MSPHSHGEPSDVVAEAGEVIVEGPDGVAVTLTPDAAEETGRRLVRAASEARQQVEQASESLRVQTDNRQRP